MLQSRLVVVTTVLLAIAHSADAAEICGNGIDDDADGFADEGCFVASDVCESPLSCNETGTAFRWSRFDSVSKTHGRLVE